MYHCSVERPLPGLKYRRIMLTFIIFNIKTTINEQRTTNNNQQPTTNNQQQAGIEIDEGPSTGGNYGPYTQSERLPLYRKHADALVSSGSAYVGAPRGPLHGGGADLFYILTCAQY